jgi:hypothetical protein
MNDERLDPEIETVQYEEIGESPESGEWEGDRRTPTDPSSEIIAHDDLARVLAKAVSAERKLELVRRDVADIKRALRESISTLGGEIASLKGVVIRLDATENKQSVAITDIQKQLARRVSISAAIGGLLASSPAWLPQAWKAVERLFGG